MITDWTYQYPPDPSGPYGYRWRWHRINHEWELEWYDDAVRRWVSIYADVESKLDDLDPQWREHGGGPGYP